MSLAGDVMGCFRVADEGREQHAQESWNAFPFSSTTLLEPSEGGWHEGGGETGLGERRASQSPRTSGAERGEGVEIGGKGFGKRRG